MVAVRRQMVNYPANLCIFNHFCCTPVAVRLHVVTFVVGVRSTILHTTVTIKRLRTLLFWAFDNNLIPQILVNSRVRLGIKQ